MQIFEFDALIQRTNKQDIKLQREYKHSESEDECKTKS